MAYMSVNLEDLKNRVKRYCFCEQCGEMSFDEHKDGEPMEECWSWYEKEKLTCPREIIDGVRMQGHDFLIIEE